MIFYLEPCIMLMKDRMQPLRQTYRVNAYDGHHMNANINVVMYEFLDLA